MKSDYYHPRLKTFATSLALTHKHPRDKLTYASTTNPTNNIQNVIKHDTAPSLIFYDRAACREVILRAAA
jgi:hypothetical protein